MLCVEKKEAILRQRRGDQKVIIHSGEARGSVFSVGRTEFERLRGGEPLDGFSCTGRVRLELAPRDRERVCVFIAPKGFSWLVTH